MDCNIIYYTFAKQRQMESLAEFKQGEDEGIKSVHDHVLYMIMSYLELRDASALMLSNRSFY